MKRIRWKILIKLWKNPFIISKGFQFNFLNSSSFSLPLVGERRQGSFVRFPNRKIQSVNNKKAFKSRMRNKQRILQQQLQKEEISSRIINRKPTRNRYQPDSKVTNQEYALDYEELDS